MDAINGVVKSLIVDVVIKAVLARLTAAIPFLGWPIIGTLVAGMLGKLGEMFAEELSKIIEFKIIDTQVGAQKEHYEKAVENLKNVLDKPKEEQSDAEISLAKEEYKKRLRELINLNNVK